MLTNNNILKRHSKLLHFLQQSLDIAIITGCLFLADIAYPGSTSQLDAGYWLALAACAATWSLGANNAGLYHSKRSQTMVDSSQIIIRIWLVTLAVLFVGSWALKTTEDFSRIIVGIWAILSPLALIGLRLVVRGALLNARKKGYNSRHIAIAGAGSSAEALLEQIQQNSWMGYQVAGIYSDAKPENLSVTPTGSLAELLEKARQQKFDAVFLALPTSQEKTLSHLINELSDCSVPVHLVPDVFTFQLLNTRLSSIGTLPLLSIYDTPHNGVNRLLKRLEDAVLASIILLLISPLMLAIALAIKLNSKGPVIFKQQRYGMKGEPIAVWKFRSMTSQDNGSVVKQATKNDSRITKVGAFLRKTSLDELPQFINVLQGRMSIVGPRPHAVAHNELYRKAIDGYMLRHLVKPGITGWAQINGWRGETDTLEKMQKRVEFDLFYIRNWSLLFDLKIITLTIFKGFLSKNAY